MEPTTLERKLGMRFQDRALLEMALVHPSYLNELRSPPLEGGSYERLEFLGDAALGLAITLELYRRCPDLPEGHLSVLRSSLVRGSTLAKVARDLGLGQNLVLGKGEEASGGRDRASNLAAAFEALVGAVFMDQGFEKAHEFVLQVMGGEVDGLLADGIPQDPKSRLQELVQREGQVVPTYRLVAEGGPDHLRTFDVEVVMNGQVMGRGQGRRKLDAEKEAARKAIQLLEAPDGA